MTGRAGFRQEEQGQPLMMIEEILIPWFILVCLLTLYLSCRQTPPDDPERKEYATAAVILFLVQILGTTWSFAWQLHVLLQSYSSSPLPPG